MIQVSTLTDEGGRLKDELHQTDHFEVIPAPVWKALHSWYFLQIFQIFKSIIYLWRYGGSPALPRIVPQPQFGESPWLELRRLQFFILRHQVGDDWLDFERDLINSFRKTLHHHQSVSRLSNPETGLLIRSKVPLLVSWTNLSIMF